MTSTQSFQTIDNLSKNFQGFITTGDKYLDDALGGGLWPGTITEFVGSSSTGKTQLALQLLLMVQLPFSKGGLEGSSCYITTSNNTLPTQRLMEMGSNHPYLSATLSIEDAFTHIETITISTFTKLVYALEAIPSIVGTKMANKGFPLRLLVIDSLDFLFKEYGTKTTDRTLISRSKDLTDLALILHRLASEQDLAILIINGVHPVFSPSNRLPFNDQNDNIIYFDQARWFARGDGVPVDGPVEAALGLVWANQIGTRVMLTRTARRKRVPESGESNKRRRFDESAFSSSSPSLPLPSSSPSSPSSPSVTSLKEFESTDLDTSTSIRQFSVVFSQFSPPVTLDYIITSAGVVSLNSQNA